MLSYPKGTDLRKHVFSQEQYLFSEEEIAGLLSPGYRNADAYKSDTGFGSVLRSLDDKNNPGEISVSERKLSVIELQALYDLENYLQDDLLTKVDRASMKYSIETRVPYLDHRMVEFAINLSPELKYRNGIYKYILKKVLYQYVPQKLFDRPKQGFAIPLNKWLHTSLNYLLDDYLSEEVIKRFGVVEVAGVNKLKSEFSGGKDFLYNRLWLLIVLHMWLIRNESKLS
jgi:asparagine synthase (glutamine-hydrolysing)